MPKREIIPFESNRVILRLLEKADLPLTLSWRNQDQIRKWFLNTAIIMEEQHLTWFEKYKELDNDFIFVILAKDLSNRAIGQISLYNIDWDTQTAEFGRLLIGETATKGKGFATDATRLLLKHGLGNMGLKKITLEVKDDNEIAIAIYRAVGFIEASRKNGLIVMAIQA